MSLNVYSSVLIGRLDVARAWRQVAMQNLDLHQFLSLDTVGKKLWIGCQLCLLYCALCLIYVCFKSLEKLFENPPLSHFTQALIIFAKLIKPRFTLKK